MKITFILMSLLFHTTSYAAGSDAVTFDGSNTTFSTELDRDVYRTEYRTEYYEDTCSREVYDGSYQDCTEIPHESCTGAPPTCRYVCHQGPQGEICQDVCSDGNEHCTTTYQTSCTSRDRYRTEYYACTQSREVPYEVFDHYLKANVRVNFDVPPVGLDLKEKIIFSLNDSTLVMNTETSKQVLLFADKEESSSIQGNTRVLNIDLKVSMKSLKDIEAGLMTLNNIKLSQDQISFESGAIDKDITFVHQIQIKRDRFLNHSEKFSASLKDNDFNISSNNGIKVYSYDLKARNVKLRKGKFKVSIVSQASFGGKVPLNSSDLPLLNQTKVSEIKIGKK